VNLKDKLSDPGTDRFVENYDSYYSIVFNSIYSKVNNFHDAEDICQEVFIRFYDRMEEVENPRKWLFGCLRLVVFDYYKMKQKKDIDVDELFEDIGMGYVNGFRDSRMMIKQVIDDICSESGDRDASLFELVAVYNYSFVQASRHLNLNYKQARYRYNVFAERVLGRLKEKGINNIEDML
jgi:DNA-directed RNA polymerase specialized sigma24 family protein